MLVNEEYIKSFTEKNLWQLSKDNLQSLATSMNIEFKKSETKDSLLSKIKNDDKFDLIYIYREFKNECFGLYPTEAQELLQIDNKTLKKLAKKDVLSIAYTRQQRLYGKYIDVPYYSLDSILTLSKDKYQANNISYLCRECRLKKIKTKATAPKVVEHKSNNNMAFGIKKNRNPIILKDGIQCLKCKACNNVKPLDSYYKAPGNANGYKNTCIECIKKKRKGLI